MGESENELISGRPQSPNTSRTEIFIISVSVVCNYSADERILGAF